MYNEQITSSNDHQANTESEQFGKAFPAKDVPRTDPSDLNEQLSLEEAKTKPSNDDDEIMKGKINDPRYPDQEWKKCQHVVDHSNGTKTDIHYWENRLTEKRHGFKFKNPEHTINIKKTEF